MDVESYLRSKGLQLKGSGSDIHLACVFCDEDPQKRGRMYVHVADDDNAGLYYCHRCQAKGNLKTLMRHFGDKPEGRDEGNSNRQALLQAAAEFYYENISVEAWAYLQKDRGLTPETIEEQQLGWADGGLFEHLKSRGFPLGDMIASGLVSDRDGKPVDFFHNEITIPYMVAGSVVMIRGKRIGGKYRTPPKQATRLFNSDATWGAERLLVCEGEFDCLVMKQMGFHAVGVPGAGLWQDTWNDYTFDTKRVFVMLDNDPAGVKGAEKIREKLGSKVRIVDVPNCGLPPGVCDLTEWVVGQGAIKDDVDALLNASVGGVLVTVDQAFLEWEVLQGMPGIQFGWETLDSRITPGLLAGEVAVILAKTNTGKTLALLNIFQRMTMVPDQDPKILFVSLEQTRGDWFERARRIWNFYNLSCPPPDVHRETLNYWRDRILIVDKNRVSEEILLECIEDYVELMGRKPDVLAVDYLGYWSASFKGKDRYEQVTNAIMSLKAISKQLLIPVITPHQVNRGAEAGKALELAAARDSGAIEETAGLVLGLWAEDNRTGTTVEQHTGGLSLSVMKTRTGGLGHIVPLVFGKTSLVIADRQESAYVRRLHQELEFAAERVGWRDVMWRHSQGQYERSILVPKYANPD